MRIAASPLDESGRLPTADDADIIGDPAVVGHAAGLGFALRNRRGPEADFCKIIQPIGGATRGILHTATIGTGRRDTWIGPEPD